MVTGRTWLQAERPPTVHRFPLDGIPNLTYDNATNRITRDGYEYDVAGNLIRSLAEDGTTGLKYEYDAANRLQAIRKNDTNQTLVQAFQFGSTNARLIDYRPTTTGLRSGEIEGSI